MKRTNLLVAGAATLCLLSSCVSSKKLKKAQADYAKLNGFYTQVQTDLKKCRDEEEANARLRAQLESELANTKNQSKMLTDNNTVMINQLKDLSVISSAQAESIKKSLENIGSKDAYIQGLQSAMARKDSLNMALVMNLKGALQDANNDIDIKVEKGVVFISISDKMLFKSGSYNITDKAMTVLGKVAQVLNNRPEIEFMVEGHTDNVAFRGGELQDNWDLSVKRATTVVRTLQNQFKIDPKRMTAGGRGEYVPLTGNETAEGRSTNRRTRIVILPQLDQFFQLLETNKQN
ncbi:OmpA family protein [Paraflavisolibacter sp. H34]|uniref:OmpA/MotB family protein n=1 Tax=Huijunlia imazamoxiresistens TaxID=3127457 RepID=UPI0030172A96